MCTCVFFFVVLYLSFVNIFTDSRIVSFAHIYIPFTFFFFSCTLFFYVYVFFFRFRAAVLLTCLCTRVTSLGHSRYRGRLSLDLSTPRLFSLSPQRAPATLLALVTGCYGLRCLTQSTFRHRASCTVTHLVSLIVHFRLATRCAAVSARSGCDPRPRP